MSEEISIENLFKDSTNKDSLVVDNEISINELFGVEEIIPDNNEDIGFIDDQVKKENGLEKTKIEKQPEIDIEAIKEQKAKRFDKGIFKMAEREAFDKYKETGEIDLNLIPEEKEDKPGFIQDKLARLARGTASTAKGFESFKTSLVLTGADIALDIFNPEITNEQKIQSLKVLKGVKDASSGIKTYDAVIKGLGDYVREYDSESITDDIASGNYAQAADRAIGGVFESAPSLALAYLGPGGLIALGTSAAGNKFDEEFEENPEEGAKRLFLNSALSGTAEASFELVTRGILGRATGLIGSGNKKAAKELVNSYGNKLLKRIATDPLAEGSSEAATEFTVDLIDLATLKSAGDVDQVLESDFYEKNWKKWTDAGIIGTVTGGGIVTTGALKNNDKAVRDAAEYTLTPESNKKIISDAAININKLNEQIKQVDNQEDVDILESEIVKEEEKIINTRKKVSEELNMMNPDELKTYAENIDQINKEKKRAQSNSIFVREANVQNLADLELENQALIRESVDRRLNENIKTVGVEDLGRTVNDYDAPSDYQKAYDNTDFGKKNSMNVESSDGFIDTEGDIYINKEVAQKVRNVNVAAHELLHGILNNNIKEPGQLKRLVTEFKAILPRETADLIQKRIDDNYRFTTDEQGNRVEIPESEYMEEYFTAFADLIGNRKVKFNENIFTKIGEKITPVFKGKGYGHIKFETGKDVYDFIKSYQKQVAKGELKPETIEAAKKVAKQDIKMSKTASENVQKIYEEQGIGGALDIIEEFKPIVSKLVQKRSEAPNFDRELLTSEIEIGLISKEPSLETGEYKQRSILGLIREYGPYVEKQKAAGKAVAPLAGFINKQLPKRMIEASQKILGESFTEDVSERVDIAAPEVEVEVKTKKEKVPRSLRKKLNIEKGSDLYNKVKDAVVKTFGTKLPEVTDPKFKKALSDSYKRELKKEVNALMGNRSDFKMFVTNNAETLYKSIPQETINKRFQAFSEPVLDKEGKPVREKTAVGKGIFKKKPFNKEEFINYFLGEDVGASTKGTRKTALSETIADEMALDATLEVLEDPKVFEKFKEIQEIEGKKVPKDIKPKISEKVKRPEGFKFSKSQENKIDDLDLSKKQKKSFEKKVFKILDNNPGLTLEEAIEYEAKAIGKSRGFAYENVIIRRLKELKIKGFVVSDQAGGNSVGIPDFAATIFGNSFDVEVKLEIAQYSSVSLIHRNQSTTFSKDKGYSFADRLTKDLIDKAKKPLDAYRKRVEELGADLKLYDRTGKLPLSIYTQLQEEGLQKAITQKAKFNQDIISELYQKKVPPTNYIQIKNKGLFFMGSNPLNLPISEFKADVNVTLRVSRGLKTDLNGVEMTTMNLRILPDNLTNVSNSDYTLDSASSVSSLMKTEAVKILEAQVPAKNSNIKELSNSVIKFSKTETNSEIIGYAKTVDEALKIARDPNAPIKKIRVFDFDDTLATTKSDVLFTKPDGTEGKLNAEEFAKQGAQLLEEGYVFDFSEFNKVTKGKPGPLLDIAKKIQVARGTEDVFVLTARNPEAQVAIKEFLDSVGLNIPLENITGLGNSTGEAKANWMVEKAAEGYNDFYFADDALQNVEAVRKSMDMLDVKSKAQLVRKNEIKFSKTSSKKLNFKTDEAGNIKANFTINNKKYNINLDSRDNKGSFDVEFDLGGRIDITGTGDAVKVVRTVYNGLLEAIDQNKKIKKIEFSSLKSEPSRVRLYTTLMNSVAKKLGWETDVWESNNFIAPEKSSYDFEITKPRKKQVAPVEKVLDVVDVKSEVQQAKIKFSKSVNEDFNKIIEQTTGIASEKVYSEAKAKVRGANKGNKKFFIPYSAEDFMGLIYPLLSKGKLGDSQMAWFKKNLLDPYAMANENIAADRIQLMEDFKALKKALEVPKDLRKKTDSGFTKEQAVRVYLFNKAGYDVPGISKTDLKELLDLVNSDGVLKAFGDQIFSITKGDGYAKPGENWLVGTITTDLIDVLNTVKRAKYLEQSGYTANAELIFSKENLNKLEAEYGTKYREAMENVLGRMKSGKNRIFSGNRLSNRVLDYINNSTGAIMFFNTRSAVLQTISAINFLNWSFNNPIKAGAAFANQPQYWKDFVELINSDYLVDRRNGLKLNINESEIADAASTSKNKAKAAINYILQKGFLPTQFADSFAIASGGATFYRNRIKDLVENQSMSEADAKKQAMLEWRETAEVSQQSSDPSKISAQQASDLGRVILAFANTPMQYARIQKRAVQDLVNGRGDAKTNVSKIIYYAVVQNLIFNALQSALFGLGFGDDEDDMTEKQLEAYEKDKKKKYLRIANGMLDSQLRGLGLAGATVAVIKNFLTDIYERSGRKRPEYVDSIYKLLQISPPVSSKISKIRGAAWQFDSKKRREEIFEKGFSIDNPAYEAGAKVISATVNVPLDRVYSKVNNISGAMDEDAETWQTVAMLAGWPEWQIMPKEKSSQELPKFSGVKIKKFKKYDYKNKNKKGEKRKFGY